MPKNNEDVKLSKNDLQDIIDFSAGLMAVDNFYSPFLSNQLLTNLNNNPRLPNAEAVKKALNDYKNSGADLQGFVEFASAFDMIFKRTLYSYANALSFDLQITCKNAYTKGDYESEEYKKDKQTVDNFLTNFDYKKEFYNVLLNVLKRDSYFTWFRKTKSGNRGKMKYALQIMPQDYCMLTGYFEKGLLWSFNVLYFMQPGVDIEGFDPSLKKTYLDGDFSREEYLKEKQYIELEQKFLENKIAQLSTDNKEVINSYLNKMGGVEVTEDKKIKKSATKVASASEAE